MFEPGTKVRLTAEGRETAAPFLADLPEILTLAGPDGSFEWSGWYATEEHYLPGAPLLLNVDEFEVVDG